MENIQPSLEQTKVEKTLEQPLPYKGPNDEEEVRTAYELPGMEDKDSDEFIDVSPKSGW